MMMLWLKLPVILLFFLAMSASARPLVAQELIQEEGELKREYLSLRERHLSPEAVTWQLEQVPDLISQRSIQEWYRAEVSFQKKYDTFQLKKQLYFAHKVASEANCWFDKLNKFQKRRLKKKLDKLTFKKAAYENNRDLFGSENDLLRAISYTEMTDAQLLFSKKLEKVLGVNNKSLSDHTDGIKKGFHLLPHLLKIQKAMIKDRNSSQGETPILDIMGEGVLAYARIQQVKTTLSGLENIPIPVYDGKTINVISFEHANGTLDTIVQSAIPKENRKGIGFFGAAQYVFPGAWVRSLEKSDHYIVVNKGREISRTRELIDSRKLHGFMAAAEGFTSSGLFETRPISPLFISTYWELHDLGYTINIIPMSYPENSLLYHELPVNRPLFVSGIIGKPLTSIAAERLLALTGERESMGIWLRSAWHRELKTDESLLLSSPGISAIERALEQRLWRKVAVIFPEQCR